MDNWILPATLGYVAAIIIVYLYVRSKGAKLL